MKRETILSFAIESIEIEPINIASHRTPKRHTINRQTVQGWSNHIDIPNLRVQSLPSYRHARSRHTAIVNIDTSLCVHSQRRKIRMPLGL